jgi:hypothetical protein
MSVYILQNGGHFAVAVCVFSYSGLRAINTMSPNDRPLVVKRESLFRRALWALPLLAIFIVAGKVLNISLSKWLPIVQKAAKSGWVEEISGKVPLRMTFTGIQGLDSFMRGPVAFFTPTIAGLDDSEF